MALPKKLETYLKTNKVPHEVVAHRTVFTAYDLAATLKEKLENIGKTLLVKADKRFVLVVLPANRRLDIPKLKKAIAAKVVSIAKEKDMVRELNVKPGAITAFGALHKLEVFADAALARASKILVGTGSFTESVRMKARDFFKLENPKTGNISSAAGLPNPVVPPKKKTPARRVAKKGKPKQRR